MRYARTTILHSFLFLFHECYGIFESASADFDNVFKIMNIMVETSREYHSQTLITRHFKHGLNSHLDTPNRPVYRKLDDNKFEIIFNGTVPIPKFLKYFPMYDHYVSLPEFINELRCDNITEKVRFFPHKSI